MFKAICGNIRPRAQSKLDNSSNKPEKPPYSYRTRNQKNPKKIIIQYKRPRLELILGHQEAKIVLFVMKWKNKKKTKIERRNCSTEYQIYVIIYVIITN
jgi:hypothetical protein